jgi:glutamine cyclotransferase
MTPNSGEFGYIGEFYKRCASSLGPHGATPLQSSQGAHFKEFRMPRGTQPSPAHAPRATEAPRPAHAHAPLVSLRPKFWLAGLGVGILLAIGGTMWLLAVEPGPTYGFRVVKAYPHDRTAYCQGLVVDGAALIEGTGRFEQSSLRRVELESGKILQRHNLDPRIFGEGVTIFGDEIFQITWQDRTCFVYDRKTFRPIKRFTYAGEGWGLTHDSTHLIMSDGSSTLRFFKPDTFEEVRRLPVKSGGRAVSQLNELEFVEGEIFANVWQTDSIARIDPKTGEVTGTIDLTQLYPRRLRAHREAVLNGIAYDAAAKRLFVTGKNWPKLYEIEVVPLRQ